MIFQIGGAPRSGTAWIASVLNLCPDIICLHEPIDQNVPAPEGAYASSGQSGSHLLLPYCRDMDADLRVFIKRDPDECYDSMEEIFQNIDMKDWRELIMEPAEEYEKAADFTIDFENLFKEDTVKFLWDSISAVDFQRDKVRHMLNMNIQRESLQYDFGEKFIEEVLKFNDGREFK